MSYLKKDYDEGLKKLAEDYNKMCGCKWNYGNKNICAKCGKIKRIKK